MTSTQIRQSFLDFFQSKSHTIVPSSSLMPDSPGLLFTNAGMNQFVPIFLNQKKPDVSKWAGVVPGLDTRAADTQKCIRAGGKHNDLEDVGLDTYHHTFFEMLGNWSFGDYFKQEAIEWAWELVVGRWKFPATRLYTTVYKPGPGEPAEFDQEAYGHWEKLFKAAGLDPKVHICTSGKKDNFWMMGETGPCGPCSELHMDLTPAGDTKGALVNQGDARCIEIWNLVFIQFNANPDGTYSPLAAKHVDTGMGFERVTSIMQGTKGLTDFKNAKISNYETDIFRPIFDVLEKLSGKKYSSTLPTRRVIENGKEVFRGANEVENTDIAFRVIADHIRTVSFAVADGIQPGNKDRNAVIRRILRRAGLFGYGLGFREPFFYKLVDVLADTMGDIFPEIRAKKKQVQEVIRIEEAAFNITLSTGIGRFVTEIAGLLVSAAKGQYGIDVRYKDCSWSSVFLDKKTVLVDLNKHDISVTKELGFDCSVFPGSSAFELHDTYGFPIEETERLAHEIGLVLDKAGFNALMDEQRARARAAQKKEVISLSQIETTTPTKFVGFDKLETDAKVVEVVSLKDKTAVILDTSACYAEMGGQVGDTGEIVVAANVNSRTSALSQARLRITNTQKSGNAWLHFIEVGDAPTVGASVTLAVDKPRRDAIQRHHTVTHLLHWALHEVVSREASQKGSFVGPDKLTFDFNSAPLTPAQVADIEKLVNERILENARVSWSEVPYADMKSRKDVMQFFGDKYGDTVRVVQIGGHAQKLDGYSMELCGGTHTRATGEIGLFRIVGESAIAAGVRRIEAIAGMEAYRKAADELTLIKSLAGKVNSPVHELENKIVALVEQQKELEKSLKAAQQREASNAASLLLEEIKPVNGVPAIIHNLGAVDGDFLQLVADALKSQFKGVIVLGGGPQRGSVALIAAVTPEFTAKVQAGKIIQQIAPIVGGKGGGKPDNARGGGKDASKLDEALAKARTLIS
ncbi:MAG: alanine--tRNA ligase [Verrucomicrobia bacterium]|jgi:alanyl-tRNA synthetase|nr:alanine--tRNA ligase [Verrucomicrobiota bacterium]